MKILLSKPNNGKTKELFTQAKKQVSRGKKVLVVSDEYSPIHSYRQLGIDEDLSDVWISKVKSMKNILTLLSGPMSYDSVFIDAHFVKADDIDFLAKLSEYIKADMFITIQANRDVANDIQILDYVRTPMGVSMNTEMMLDMANKLRGVSK